MKKLMALAAMLAMMLVAASPALAGHATGGDVDLQFVDASQTQAAAALQTNEGNAEAGNLGSAAAIEQSLTIEQSQVNAGVGGVAGGGTVFFPFFVF